jgi:hypothetical protein
MQGPNPDGPAPSSKNLNTNLTYVNFDIKSDDTVHTIVLLPSPERPNFEPLYLNLETWKEILSLLDEAIVFYHQPRITCNLLQVKVLRMASKQLLYDMMQLYW